MAEEFHFGRAVKRVHIVQQTFSAQIAYPKEWLRDGPLQRLRHLVRPDYIETDIGSATP